MRRPHMTVKRLFGVWTVVFHDVGEGQGDTYREALRRAIRGN